MPELKPCPFCGGKAEERSCDRLITIGCPVCDYRMAFHGILSIIPSPVKASPEGDPTPEYYHADAHEKAAEVWNRRAEDGK